jgi:hypothetical protein
VKAYLLIEAVMGKAGAVADGIRTLQMTEARLLSADTVTGPFDVIVAVETADLDTLIRSVTGPIQAIEGVQRTITCVT